VTRIRCGGKYDIILVANLLLSPTVKKFLKSANTSQSYERISSGTFFMAHGVQSSKSAITTNVTQYLQPHTILNVKTTSISLKYRCF